MSIKIFCLKLLEIGKIAEMAPFPANGPFWPNLKLLRSSRNFGEDLKEQRSNKFYSLGNQGVEIVFCCIVAWIQPDISGCQALELFHCLPLWKTALFVSSRAFLLSTPTFLLSTSVEISEATWKKATKCNKCPNITLWVI